MMPESCVFCRFYQEWWDGQKGMADQLEDTDEPWGMCRRYPPARNLGQYWKDFDSTTGFPIVARDTWCGEFQTLKLKGK